jgi:peptidyl-prolyl cis-trans isomerase B (cyclophilin B)
VQPRHLALLLAAAMLVLPGAAQAKNPVVELSISIGGKAAGSIKITLEQKKAPKTVANFLKYVKKGHYKGTLFHRVIDNFMVQGGGFTPDYKKKKTDASIKNEAFNGLKNTRGTVAMARTPNPHSAQAQFFVNVKDNAFLNHRGKSQQGWGYCVFGKVTAGMKLVETIKKLSTGSGGPFGKDVPTKPVMITKAKLL